jgi:hypothetical protein
MRVPHLTIRRLLATGAATLFSVSSSACGGDGGEGARLSLSPGAAAPTPAEVPAVSWRLMGTRENGRALLVQAREGDNPCVTYRAKSQQTDSSISVSVVKDRSDCTGEIIDSAKAPPRLKVRLTSALGGRRVAGPNRLMDEKNAVVNTQHHPPRPFEVPDLKGLSLTDARRVARLFSTSIQGAPTSGPYVRSQTPAPGKQSTSQALPIEVRLR